MVYVNDSAFENFGGMKTALKFLFGVLKVESGTFAKENCPAPNRNP